MGMGNPNAGGAPGGPQGGGGKGGMGMNRGPGGNAQNNPGMGGWANMKAYPGLGSAGVSQMTGQPGGPQANYGLDQMGAWGGKPAMNPGMGNWANAMQKFGQMGSGGTPMPSFQFNRPEMQSGNLTPINQAIPTPQPQEPVGGYINGMPAQWHYQAEALKNPPPRTNSVGLPSGGILAKLYGG